LRIIFANKSDFNNNIPTGGVMLKKVIMIEKLLRILLILLLFSPWLSAVSQNVTTLNQESERVLDSLKRQGVIFGETQKKPEISLTVSQAIRFLQQRYQPQFWQNQTDPFRQALGQLIFQASNPPYDSTSYQLRKFPYDSLNIPWDKFYIWEPMRIRLPVNELQKIPRHDNQARPDTAVHVKADTILPAFDNPPLPEYSYRTVAVQKDTSIMVIIDTLHEVTSPYSGSPFKYFNYPYQSDSIKVAVNELMKFLDERDSSKIYLTGRDHEITPFMLNSRSGMYARYWLKNDLNDSVTVWIGNNGKDTIGLYLEKEVTFRRPPKQGNYSDARINVQEVDKSKLLEVQKIYIKPHYWKERMEANFIMNQTALSNWIKGGENSFATTMDITEYANYENKAKMLSSANFFRLKLGFLATGSNSIRKNLDLIETNSKLNHKAFGKFDFSAIMLFKTQLMTGYIYSDTSRTPVSKFLNPGTLTLGIGLDYKPNKTTSINFSPLSYKGTFMANPVGLDPTIYGIPKGKSALHEPGISLLVTNEYKPVKSVTVTNRVQLFTNYIHNPQNVDVDWEMIATANINWFMDLRLNTHLIYDDDSRVQKYDKDHNPMTNTDGSPRKIAMAQFKEILGLSAVFRF
jgi:hypothetical protein